MLDAHCDQVMPLLGNMLKRIQLREAFGSTCAMHGAIIHPLVGNPMTGPAPGVQHYWCR
ncbi:MAG: hypothetical protein AB8B58_02650 [Roseobacter sp.]